MTGNINVTQSLTLGMCNINLTLSEKLIEEWVMIYHSLRFYREMSSIIIKFRPRYLVISGGE